MSSRLAEFICFYANRMSFQEVDRLLRKRCFVPLSSQTLHRITQRVAKDLDQADQERIAAAAEEKMPELVEEVDVYDPEAPEVLVMEDGILAKAQKPQRRADVKRPTRFIATDLGQERKLQEDLIAILRIEYPEEIERMKEQQRKR